MVSCSCCCIFVALFSIFVAFFFSEVCFCVFSVAMIVPVVTCYPVSDATAAGLSGGVVN